MKKVTRDPRPKWTKEEDQILRENYPTMRKNVSQLLPGRSPAACCIRASNLKISIYSKDWTEEEDNLFREKYPALGEKLFKMLPNHSALSCRAHVDELGLTHTRGAWLESEDEILREYYPTMGIAMHDKLPYRSRQSIYCRAIRLGLVKEERQTNEDGTKKMPKNRNCWTIQEDEILRTQYPKIGIKVKDMLPNRTVGSIYARCIRLKIVRDFNEQGA